MKKNGLICDKCRNTINVQARRKLNELQPEEQEEQGGPSNVVEHEPVEVDDEGENAESGDAEGGDAEGEDTESDDSSGSIDKPSIEVLNEATSALLSTLGLGSIDNRKFSGQKNQTNLLM